jgi:hypothetical protein
MLTRFHKIMTALLLLQVGLIALVLGRPDEAAARKPTSLLPGLDAAKISRLQVFAGKAAAIDLVKHGEAWVLASQHDYPAQEAKISATLAALTRMAASAPIAEQKSRHRQLGVADDDFQRKLVITADGHDTTIFLGGAAGARLHAVRLGGSDAVYAVSGPAASSVGATPTAWVDTRYLEVPRDRVASITIAHGGTTVELTAPPAAADGAPATGPWSAKVGGQPLAKLDAATVDKLVGAATTITLESPADPARDASAPLATITIERRGADSSTPAPLIVDVLADGDGFWVHERGSSRAARVGKAQLQDLLGVDAARLAGAAAP